MQTKKRAKSVRFGKSETKKVVEVSKKPNLIVEKALEVEKKVKEVAPIEEDTEVVKEIKQTIEEKIHPKEEDMPEEVDLSAKEPSEEIENQNDEVQEEQQEEKKSEFGSFTNDFDEKSKKKGGNLRFFFVIVIITFILGLVIIEGVYFLTTQKNLIPKNITLIPKNQPTSTTAPVKSDPTPTEKPADLSAYNIKVLNGSGITGEAAKVKAELTNAGFVVDEVGNADANDYTNTVVAVKKGTNAAYTKALVKALSTSYKVDATVTQLSDSNSSDVIVTIGSSTAE